MLLLLLRPPAARQLAKRQIRQHALPGRLAGIVDELVGVAEDTLHGFEIEPGGGGRIVAASRLLELNESCGVAAGAVGAADLVAVGAAEPRLGLPARHLTDRWVTDLGSYENYLARLGIRARANLRRNERRSREAGVAIEILPVEHAALDEIAVLCTKTASRFENNGFYPGATFSRFVTALGDLAHVIEVRQHGKLVAAGVCLADATRFHTWTCGVDYAVDGRYSPYGVLFAESVKLAIRLGRTTLEGGRGNADFKRRYGLSPRHLDAVLIRV